MAICCINGITVSPIASTDPCVAQARVGSTFVGTTGLIYILNGQDPTIAENWKLIEFEHSHNINDLTDVDTVTIPPTLNSLLTWTGNKWQPTQFTLPDLYAWNITTDNINWNNLLLNSALNVQDALNILDDHKHSALDITSGILPIERGGTGASNAEIARNNLGLGINSSPQFTNLNVTNSLVVNGVEITGVGGTGGGEMEVHALNGPFHTGQLNWSQLNKTGSNLSELETKSHSSLDGIGANDHHNQIHSITGSDHTVIGSQYSVVGLTATNTLGILNSTFDGAANHNVILRSGNNGDLRLDILYAPQISTISGDLLLNPFGEIVLPNDKGIRSQEFNSSFPIEGWQIDETNIDGVSLLTIGKIQADELSVRVFVADEVRIDRGDEYWSKSYGIVAQEFTTPNALNGTVSVTFEDSPALTGAIFSNNDWLLFRIIDIDTGLEVSNIWGQIAAYVDNGNDTQSWTFTLRLGPTNVSVKKGVTAVDFGQSGQAVIHLSTIDDNGAPYIKLRRWEGANPFTPSNFTDYVVIGDLDSLANSYYSPVGDGLYIQGPTDEQFIVADENGLQIRGADFKLFNGADQTVYIASNDGSVKLGIDITEASTTSFDFNGTTGDIVLRGSVEAANGQILLNEDGVSVDMSTIEQFDNLASYKFLHSTDVVGGLFGFVEVGLNNSFISLSNSHPGKNPRIGILAVSSNSNAITSIAAFDDVNIENKSQITLFSGTLLTPAAINIETVSFNITPVIGTDLTLNIGGDILPTFDLAYNLGSPTKQWDVLHVRQIIADTFSGATLSGQEWEYYGSMVIDANNASDTTVSIVNQNSGVASLDVEGNITLGGTIDGVDISAHVTGVGNAVHGLGTISTQNSNSIAITGGSITGITDLALADGGTGASNAANARINLGLGPNDSPIFTNLTLSGNLIISGNISNPSGNLLINPAIDLIIPNDKGIGSSIFSSGFPIQGWKIDEIISGQSGLTIGKIQADELSVKVFVADETRIDRGDEYWAKSYGIVAQEFTTPAINGTVSIKFEDSAALTGAIFSNNDWILIRVIDIGVGLEVSNIWGQVNTYVNNNDGTQNWTFTLRSGLTNSSIKNGSTAINFGQSNQGIIHLSTVDDSGAPYIKLRRWAGANPISPSNFTDYVIIGSLNGLTIPSYSPSGDGLYIRSGASENQFIVADENGLQIRGVDLKLFNNTNQTVNLSNTGTDVWIGASASDKRLTWNGTTLSVTGQIVVQSGSSGYSNITDKPTSLSGINSTEGTKLSGIETGATVGAIWGTNLNSIPDRFGNSPTVAGLYLTPTNLGYFDGSLWKAWLANTGEFYFGGDSGAHLEWDGIKLKGIGTDGLIEQWYASSLDGKIYAGNGSVVISSLGVDIASYSGASLNPTENINAVAWWKQPASIGTQNFVTNSSFEINTTDWFSSWGDSIIRSNEQALYGTFSLKITSVGSVGHGAFTDVTGLIAGQTYTISAWFYVPTSYGSNDLRLRIYDGANFNNAILSSNITERNQWARRSLTLTPTQTTIRILPYGNHSVNGLIFYFDGVQLEKNIIATPYVEGLQNSPLSRIWGGETNAGPSLQFDVNPAEVDGPRMFIQGFKGNNGDGLTTLWLQNINSIVGFPGLFASRNSLTDSITFSGNVRSNADFLPNSNEGFNLGTASVRWDTIHARQIIVDTVSGDTMSGAEWEHEGDIVIDANNASDTTVSITNQSTGIASLNVEGNITLGGSVDGINIAEHNHSGGSNGVQLSHSGLSGLTGTDHHTQYVHVSTARTITAQHTFANTSTTAPFLIGGSSVNVLVSGLNSDLLDGQHGSYYRNVDNVNAGTLPILRGGTGASTAINARINLGLVIGTNVQAWDTNLDQIAALTPTDSNFIVGNGSAWIAESGNTARTSLGLGTADTPAFTRLTLSQATGTAPLTVSSTTVVSNLNSDLLDGQHGSYYQNATNINAGTLADARLSSNVALENVANVFTANQTINGNLAVDTNVLFVDATNNNVGIGTIEPKSNLQIVNNVGTGFLDQFSEYQILLYEGANASSSYGIGITASTLIFNTGGGYRFDKTGNSTLMFLDGGGNVGIGTTSPSSKLDVSGEITSDALTVNGLTEIYQGDVNIYGYDAALLPSLVINNTTPLFYADVTKMSIGINRDPDIQFSLDVAGALRADWLIGPHAIQLSDAELIAHYDGPGPFETNFTGTPQGHKGQVGTETGGVIYRPGKFGKGVQLAEATTNLVTDPQFFSGLGGYFSSWGDTRSQSQDVAFVGENSLKIASDGSTMGCGVSEDYTGLSATTYTLSAYFYVPSSYDGEGDPYLTAYNGATFSGGISSDTVTERNQWVRRSVTITLTGSTLRSLCYASANPTTGRGFYVDAIQLEQKAYATPYCDGSLGSGHTWSGTAHASTSIRTVAGLYYVVPELSPSEGTIMEWISISDDSGQFSMTQPGLWIWNDDWNTQSLTCYFNNTKSNIAVFSYADSVNQNLGIVAPISWSANEWHHVAVVWDSTSLKLYIDGQLQDESPSWTPPNIVSRHLYIGQQVGSSRTMNGLVDDLVVLSRAASADEIRAIYESNAPVFAESSTNFFKSFGPTPVEINEEGLFVKGDTLGPIFAIIGTSNGKDWGGFVGSDKLGEGDLLIGTKNTSYIHWDSSESKVIVAGEMEVREDFRVFANTQLNPTVIPGTAIRLVDDDANTIAALYSSTNIGGLYGGTTILQAADYENSSNIFIFANNTDPSGTAKIYLEAYSINGYGGIRIDDGIGSYQIKMYGFVEVNNSMLIDGDLEIDGNIIGSIGFWNPLTFSANWANFGGTWETGEYKKVGDLVFLRGLVSTGATSWASQPNIAVLPVGFRPASDIIVSTISGNNNAVRLDIQTDGVIKWAGGGTGNNWISLSGIVFSTSAT